MIRIFKKLNRKKRFFILITAIIVIFATIIILSIMNNPKSGGKESTTTASNENSSTVSDNTKAEKCLVSFFDLNGKLISKETVIAGGFAIPPKEDPINEGYLFLGWNKPISYIRGDMDVFPSFRYIGKTKNAIYSDAVYARNGETADVIIKLNGIVGINDLHLTIAYNPVLLKYIGTDGNNAQVKISTKKKEYKINLNLSSKSEITKEMILSILKFKVLDNTNNYAELKITVDKAKRGINNGVSANADYTVVNGKIYIY